MNPPRAFLPVTNHESPVTANPKLAPESNLGEE
jgi:hypothetical protein